MVLVAKPEGKNNLGDLTIDGRIILKWKGVDWIHVAHDRSQWQALVNMVMNILLT
jgi:hypothetical protein